MVPLAWSRWRRAGSLIMLAVGLCGAASLSFPKLSGRVSDAAGILDPASRAQLETRLAQIDQRTGVEIAVATIDSLGSEPIETYANALFHQWGVGKKGADNGVLVLIVPRERKARIEVGYGLEPKLTDGTCGEIIRAQMGPSFRAGRYAEGLMAAVDAIEAHLTGDLPPVPLSARRSSAPAHVSSHWIVLAFIGFFMLPGTTIGALIGGAGYFFFSTLLGFLLVPVGLLFDLLRKSAAGPGSRFSGGGWNSGGWGGGGFGGFGGGGGSGGGGFGGFGGGSSGGGGASGSW